MGKATYAYSIKTIRVKEKDFPYNGQRITCTNDLINFARALQDSDIEKFLVVYLDAQNSVIGIQVMNGTVNQAVVYHREVVRHALLFGAVATILIHNHPSGKVSPSDQDMKMTEKIVAATALLDIHVHDHIIIGETGFYSFLEEGVMPK
jgi:DNA repair protein RadC